MQIDSDKKMSMQLQVLSTDGKVVLSSSVTVAESSILRSINISALPKGNYYLKVFSLNHPMPVPTTSGEGREAQDEQVVKFEKL